MLWQYSVMFKWLNLTLNMQNGYYCVSFKSDQVAGSLFHSDSHILVDQGTNRGGYHDLDKMWDMMQAYLKFSSLYSCPPKI